MFSISVTFIVALLEDVWKRGSPFGKKKSDWTNHMSVIFKADQYANKYDVLQRLTKLLPKPPGSKVSLCFQKSIQCSSLFFFFYCENTTES